MGFLLNPIVLRWLAIVGILLASFATGWVKRGVHDQTKYDALQAQFEGFKAKVAGEGIAAQQRNISIVKAQKEVNDATVSGLKSDLASVHSAYDAARADLDRVRGQSDARGRALSSLARSSIGTCSGQVDQLSGRLDALERGNLSILERAQTEHVKYVRLWDDWNGKLNASRNAQ